MLAGKSYDYKYVVVLLLLCEGYYRYFFIRYPVIKELQCYQCSTEAQLLTAAERY